VLPPGWVGTAPAGGAHAITAVDGQTYSGRDFGSGLADAPPVATLVSAPNVTTYGGASYYYSVRYGDAVSVDYTSIANGHDTEVTGPGGFVAQSTLANLGLYGNQWTATYLITPPGGTWDAADVGAYTISLRENEVSDLGGHFTKRMAGKVIPFVASPIMAVQNVKVGFHARRQGDDVAPSADRAVDRHCLASVAQNVEKDLVELRFVGEHVR